VAFCDVSTENIEGTLAAADKVKASGVLVTGHVADVSVEADWLKFREDAMRQHGRDNVNLLFCQAGIGGGGSMFTDSRQSWERCFNIVWLVEGSKAWWKGDGL
jgi:NAD(P)-dependent dehydrogenase (short-subunit alcohol dehydrogenase family)